MTRNKRFHRPDEYDISWSSSGSESEDEPKTKKKTEWINLRILTQNLTPVDVFNGKRKVPASSNAKRRNVPIKSSGVDSSIKNIESCTVSESLSEGNNISVIRNVSEDPVVDTQEIKKDLDSLIKKNGIRNRLQKVQTVIKNKQCYNLPIQNVCENSIKAATAEKISENTNKNGNIHKILQKISSRKQLAVNDNDESDSPLLFSEAENGALDIFTTQTSPVLNSLKNSPAVLTKSPILFSTCAKTNKKSNSPLNISQTWTQLSENYPTPVNISLIPSPILNITSVQNKNITLNSSPKAVTLEDGLSPVIDGRGYIKSPILGGKRKSVMRQLSKFINTSLDLFSTQYDIDVVETQDSEVNPGLKKRGGFIEVVDTQKSEVNPGINSHVGFIEVVDTQKSELNPEINKFSDLINVNETQKSELSPELNKLSGFIDFVETQKSELNKRDGFIEFQENSLKSSDEISAEILPCSLQSLKSLYEIDTVSSQEVEEVTTHEDPLTITGSDYWEMDNSKTKRKRYKKGGFASQALAAIKHCEADVHIWKHEVYLNSDGMCVQPELIRRFNIIGVVDEFGKKIARCSNEKLRCFVIMENCDEGDVKIGRQFKLFPPYTVKQIVEKNVCFDVYLRVTKILFSD